MKAILEFNLPEEQEDFELCQKGWAFRCVIDEFYEKLRKKLKYEDLTSEERKIYEEVRKMLFETEEEYLP